MNFPKFIKVNINAGLIYFPKRTLPLPGPVKACLLEPQVFQYIFFIFFKASFVNNLTLHSLRRYCLLLGGICFLRIDRFTSGEESKLWNSLSAYTMVRATTTTHTEKKKRKTKKGGIWNTSWKKHNNIKALTVSSIFYKHQKKLDVPRFRWVVDVIFSHNINDRCSPLQKKSIWPRHGVR